MLRPRNPSLTSVSPSDSIVRNERPGHHLAIGKHEDSTGFDGRTESEGETDGRGDARSCRGCPFSRDEERKGEKEVAPRSGANLNDTRYADRQDEIYVNRASARRRAVSGKKIGPQTGFD